MQPLDRLWFCLESIPGLCLLRSDWEGRLGHELPAAEPFLRPTDRTAQSYPCPDTGGGCARRVVVHDTGEIVAVCGESPRRCERVVLSKSDVLLHRFDVQTLCRELARLLEIEPRFEAVTGTGATWVVGVRSPSQGDDFLVYLTIPLEPEDLLQAVSRLVGTSRERFLLLAPTEDNRDLTVRELLRLHPARFDTLKAVLGADSEGKLVLARTVSEVFADLEVTPADESANLFERRGDTWTIRYRAQTVHLSHVVGLGYIAALLREPGREIHAAAMPAAAGEVVKPAFSPQGRLEVERRSGDLTPTESRLDEKALAQLKARVRKIRKELSEAESFYDLGRAERLRQEKESIESHVASALGLGGRRRGNQDPVKRARDRVRKAIDLALRKIAVQHPALGRHLDAAVQRSTSCSYCPEETTSWIA